jgi:ABC-type multidrug transport system permease subunit
VTYQGGSVIAHIQRSPAAEIKVFLTEADIYSMILIYTIVLSLITILVPVFAWAVLTANEIIESGRGFFTWLIASLVWVVLMMFFVGGAL